MPTLQLANYGTDQHPVFGPVKYRVEDLGWDADGQVARTMGLMGQRVREDVDDPAFQAWARQVVGAIPGQLPDSMVIERAYQHVKGMLQFQRDEVTGGGIGGWDRNEVVEVIIRPSEMAKFVQNGVGTGDCDDFTMYLAAILTVYGIPTAFCTVAADSRAPQQYSHVYVVAYPRNEQGSRGRVALDASHGNYPGWEVPNVFGRIREWPVSTTGSWVDLLGWVAVAGTMVALAIEVSK